MHNPVHEVPCVGLRLKPIISAAWQLYDKIQRLNPDASSGVNALMFNMRVVKEAREKLDMLAGRFTGRALQHMTTFVSSLSGDVMGEWSKASDRKCEGLGVGLMVEGLGVRARGCAQPGRSISLHSTSIVRTYLKDCVHSHIGSNYCWLQVVDDSCWPLLDNITP